MLSQLLTSSLTHCRRIDPPETLPYQVTLRYFTDYYNQTHVMGNTHADDLAEAFKVYQADFQRQQFAAVFENFREQAWFMDRYDPSPEADERRKATRMTGRAGKMDAFVSQMESGSLDNVSLDRAREFLPKACCCHRG